MNDNRNKCKYEIVFCIGVNTLKWVSPQKELDHGIPHLREYFP